MLMIKEGDLALIYNSEHRNYLVKITPDRFHTDKGFLDLSQAIGKPFGLCLKTNTGEIFYILCPSLYDMMMKVNRKTQIIYPKDAGLILMKANIFPGAKVIESGVGSGSLTSAMANFVRTEGKVYSYERNIDFLNNARKNLEKNGLAPWVELKHREVTDSFDETDVDFVMIDIGAPWELIEAADKSLKPGGRLASICPTFDQLTQFVFTLEDKGYVHIESMELISRRILVRRGKTRPEQRIPSHTGFLVFASKTLR